DSTPWQGCSLPARLDYVMGLRAFHVGHGKPCADLDTFYSVDAHYRLGDSAIKSAVPLDMAAQPDRHAASDNFKNTAQGLSFPLSHVDRCHHCLFCSGIGTADRGTSYLLPIYRLALFCPVVANAYCVAVDGNVKLF
ncbi:unnamed protein product, partial [marine sediment metagenome]